MSVDFTKLAAPAVLGLTPYVPGKPLGELERELGIADSVKLASNENPLGPSAKAVAAATSALRAVRLYPDGNGHELRQALARFHAVPPECITLGNGSNDLLVMLAEAFLTPDVEAVYSDYCFAVYPLAVQATGATAKVAPAFGRDAAMPLGHDLEALRAAVTARTRLVFLANPNNPTGTWVGGGELKRFLASLPATTLAVADEAYCDYGRSVGCPDASAWLAEFPNLVVVRTFSKAYGLAGLRIGYGLSHPQVAELLNRVRQPFNVNAVSLAAASAALEDRGHVESVAALNRAGIERLTEGCRALGVKPFPSAANFVLVDCGRAAAPVYESLLRAGVIVRPMTGYGLPNCLRITTGTREQDERCLEALGAALRDRA
ncbi:MAG TPA: histidinol-phosphate transaminase [Steroidobacteraceae bacterium]|nr:histidinol-phosphate transaminase [Steroidobacteraceae bacterium]